MSFSVVARALLEPYKMTDITAFLGLKIYFSEVEAVARSQIRVRSFTPCALKWSKRRVFRPYLHKTTIFGHF